MPDYEYEAKAISLGFQNVCGVDEAGRGPLAGPVYAAAVILPQGLVIDGLNDSKKLSEKKRELLYDKVTESALAWSVGVATEQEIDEINILQATFLAMRRAVDGLALKADYALVDGNRMPELSINGETVIKGDSLSMSIAAASIIAKVSRDRFMLEIDEKYPEYQFSKHKGYGTKQHTDAILKYGVTPIHRPSFLKKLLK